MRRGTFVGHLVLVSGLSLCFAAARAQDTGQQQEAPQLKAAEQTESAPAPQTDVLATAAPTAVPSASDSAEPAKDAADPGTDPAPAAADTVQHHPMTGWPETGWPETAAPKPATPETPAPASAETPAKQSEPAAVTPAAAPEATPQPSKPVFTVGADVRELLPKECALILGGRSVGGYADVARKIKAVTVEMLEGLFPALEKLQRSDGRSRLRGRK